MNDFSRRLAEHGFESNQDFGTAIRCLLARPPGELRCVEVSGPPGRRKTAFAYALAQVLDYPELRYHEFRPDTGGAPPPGPLEHREQDEPGTTPLDPVMAEICALSEGERSVLILDQLQHAPFIEHLRLADFLRTRIWRYGDLVLQANPANLMILFVSETPLYHGLRRHAFRIWVDGETQAPSGRITPDLLGLGPEAQPLIAALNRVFEALGVHPTLREFRHVVHDVHTLVQDLDDLLTSIYGWVEGVSRAHVADPDLRARLAGEMRAIRQYLAPGGEMPLPAEDDQAAGKDR